MSVSMNPGATLFTVTFREAISQLVVEAEGVDHRQETRRDPCESDPFEYVERRLAGHVDRLVEARQGGPAPAAAALLPESRPADPVLLLARRTAHQDTVSI